MAADKRYGQGCFYKRLALMGIRAYIPHRDYGKVHKGFLGHYFSDGQWVKHGTGEVNALAKADSVSGGAITSANILLTHCSARAVRGWYQRYGREF